MITDNQLQIIKDRCVECLNQHRRDLTVISTEFQNKLVPSNHPKLPPDLDKLFSKEMVGSLSNFGDRFSEEIISLIEQMKIAPDQADADKIVDTCSFVFSDDTYMHRLEAYESMIATWFSRFNMKSPRGDSKKKFLHASFSCWVSNTLREKQRRLKNRVGVLVHACPDINNGSDISNADNLPSEKIVVLFIASNPVDQDQLRLDEEIRLIEHKIQTSKYRDSVELKAIWAARPGDLLQAINEYGPTIVHFSGHGSPQDELILQDEAGNTKKVSKAALVEMFKITSSGIKLVVFNTCLSSDQAFGINQHIPATIGMNDSIGDDAARVFSAQLYSAIGFGKSVSNAFGQAKAALILEEIPEERTPELHLATDSIGDELVLVRL